MPPKKRTRPTADPAPMSKSKAPKTSAPTSRASTTSRSKSKAKASATRPSTSRVTDERVRRVFMQYAHSPSDDDDVEPVTGANIEDLVIGVSAVYQALEKLGIPAPPDEFFDEDAEDGLVWAQFRDLAGAMRESAEDEGGSDDEDEYGEEGEDGDDEASKEVQDAFQLFVGPEAARYRHLRERRISVQDLARIARELKEEVSEEVLRLMIEEANGEGGEESVRRGVDIGAFEAVMRRAKMFK